MRVYFQRGRVDGDSVCCIEELDKCNARFDVRAAPAVKLSIGGPVDRPFDTALGRRERGRPSTLQHPYPGQLGIAAEWSWIDGIERATRGEI